MPSLLVQAPDRGLNALAPDNILNEREAGAGSQNVLYENGLIQTPFGFSKLSSAGLPLNSGDIVLGLHKYTELDGTEHIMGVVTEKIYEHDHLNETWTDKTQSGVTMGSDVYHPVSFVEMGHTDGLALNGTGDSAYYHLIICDGGVSSIQRWAGKYETDFADLGGGADYHGISTSRALQINLFYNHFILLSPLEYSGGVWNETPQRVRWGATGLLETSAHSGDYAGYSDLIDTGDKNVWSAIIGTELIIYQKHSIWGLNHVGGTDVFTPRILIPDLGLLAPHLLVSKNNIHYFVGNDYNVYAYYGGTVKQAIGDKIQDSLESDLEVVYDYRCWMVEGAKGQRLWILIVPTGSTYPVKAYIRNQFTGAWTVRDFSHKWTTATSGISSAAIVPAQSYFTGDTYSEAVTSAQTYAQAVTAGTTYRQSLVETRVEDRVVLGDNSGYVYQFDESVTTDDTVSIPATHYTKVFDLKMPDTFKRWPGIAITAKGTSVIVDWDLDDGGFTSNSATTLTSDFEETTLYINDTSKRVQFRFTNTSGADFQIREFKILEPFIEGDR